MGGDTYQAAGVDIGFLENLKEQIKGLSALTHGPEVLNSGGSFAGLYRLSGYRQPVLVASTDGVGTKVKIAAQLGHYESVGQDLVSLNVNDILTKGAKPLFFLDYIAFANLDRQSMETLVRGIVWGCREAGCALIGGETAQMPGVYSANDFDLVGFVVGAAEADRVVDGRDIQPGDQLLGIPSSGVHTNGFSLIRRVFKLDDHPSVLFRHYDDLRHQLGEELLIRHRCYFPLLEPVLPLVKGLAHVTGGGLPGKIPAVLPAGTAAEFDLGSWSVPPIFSIVQREGGISNEEMYRVFNMGLGIVAVCEQASVATFQDAVPEARVVGRIVPRQEDRQVVFNGG